MRKVIGIRKVIEFTNWITNKKMKERFLQVAQYDNKDELRMSLENLGELYEIK